jgi:hypothetical protein
MLLSSIMAGREAYLARDLQRVRKKHENQTQQPTYPGEGKPMPVYDRITTTIEREWLAQIIAGTKKIEYRQIKPYWTKRFEKVTAPFELRLLNGMNRPVPEVTVLIHKITKDRRRWRITVAHQEGSGLQTLGQAAAENPNGESSKYSLINQFAKKCRLGFANTSWYLAGCTMSAKTWVDDSLSKGESTLGKKDKEVCATTV